MSVCKLVAAIVFAAMLVSCGFKPNQSFNFNNEERTYTLSVPKSLGEKPAPLLLVLHGNPSAGWQMQKYSGMNKVAKKEGFIVAYPDAMTKKWPFHDSTEIQHEVDYIAALIDEVAEAHPIDMNRLYISGISGGGIFSMILSQELKYQPAAIAVVAGNQARYLKPNELTRPTPLLLIHGTDDFIYEGRAEDLFSAEASLANWGQLNSCEDQAEVTQIPSKKKNPKTWAEQFDWSCRGGDNIRFYKIHHGGHHWPGGNFNANHFTKLKLGKFHKELEANDVIWEFVSRFELNNH